MKKEKEILSKLAHRKLKNNEKRKYLRTKKDISISLQYFQSKIKVDW